SSLFILRRARRLLAWRGGMAGRWSWRRPLHQVFERLETSPGQEKVLVQAAEDVSGAATKLKGAWSDTRQAWARSLRGEHFDAEALRELDAKQDALVAEMRETLRVSLSRIHEALDPRQRQELADLLERDGYRAYALRGHCRRGGHAWRGAWAG
ncbi:MAG: Spy/CpxP family protein refolding chaperone, partial [Cystobacter sp.]